MSELQVKEILETYNKMVQNTREALRLAEVPESQIVIYTINLPDLQRMIPEDIVRLYNDVKKLTTISLHELGFSQRETSRRLGGPSNYPYVNKTILEYQSQNKVNKATIEEVSGLGENR